MVYDAIMKVSKENQYDSAADFIKNLQWDGTPRLDTWLMKTYGTPDDAYHRAVGANWLKGLVKRIIVPGCKFDFVLVLEGKQGSRKSTSLAILGGEWHVETTMSTDTKDFFMQFQGKAIVEFSEGETLSRTEVKRMKAIITMQSDKFRPPYGRVSLDFPRRCVFAMTTNQDEYLKDETGNRRWLPVTVRIPQANTEWLAENRNQLFAEAYYRAIGLNETVYEFPETETLLEQHKRRIEDPNLDAVMDWYHNKLYDHDRAAGITTYQVVRDALHNGFFSRPMTKFEEATVVDILKNFMNLERRRMMINGKRSIRWFDPKQPVMETMELVTNQADDEF
jgi:predicted P-loop ATPase